MHVVGRLLLLLGLVVAGIHGLVLLTLEQLHEQVGRVLFFLLNQLLKLFGDHFACVCGRATLLDSLLLLVVSGRFNHFPQLVGFVCFFLATSDAACVCGLV